MVEQGRHTRTEFYRGEGGTRDTLRDNQIPVNTDSAMVHVMTGDPGQYLWGRPIDAIRAETATPPGLDRSTVVVSGSLQVTFFDDQDQVLSAQVRGAGDIGGNALTAPPGASKIKFEPLADNTVWVCVVTPGLLNHTEVAYTEAAANAIIPPLRANAPSLLILIEGTITLRGNQEIVGPAELRGDRGASGALRCKTACKYLTINLEVAP